MHIPAPCEQGFQVNVNADSTGAWTEFQDDREQFGREPESCSRCHSRVGFARHLRPRVTPAECRSGIEVDQFVRGKGRKQQAVTRDDHVPTELRKGVSGRQNGR